MLSLKDIVDIKIYDSFEYFLHVFPNCLYNWVETFVELNKKILFYIIKPLPGIPYTAIVKVRERVFKKIHMYYILIA